MSSSLYVYTIVILYLFKCNSTRQILYPVALTLYGLLECIINNTIQFSDIHMTMFSSLSHSLKMALERKPKHIAVMIFNYLLNIYFMQ